MRRRTRAQRKDDAELLSDLMAAWNDYPPRFRAVLMVEWPDLYFSVSRMVRREEVLRQAHR